MIDKMVVDTQVDTQIDIKKLYLFYKLDIEPILFSKDFQSSLLSTVLDIDNLKSVPLKYLPFCKQVDIAEIDYSKEMIGNSLEVEPVIFRVPINNTEEYADELLELLQNKSFSFIQAIKTLESIFESNKELLTNTGFSSLSLSLYVEYDKDYNKFYIQFSLTIDPKSC